MCGNRGHDARFERLLHKANLTGSVRATYLPLGRYLADSLITPPSATPTGRTPPAGPWSR
jgi:hypothetical protein